MSFSAASKCGVDTGDCGADQARRRCCGISLDAGGRRDVLFIEANRMKGKGGFTTVTGQIGDVMKEEHCRLR